MTNEWRSSSSEKLFAICNVCRKRLGQGRSLHSILRRQMNCKTEITIGQLQWFELAIKKFAIVRLTLLEIFSEYVDRDIDTYETVKLHVSGGKEKCAVISEREFFVAKTFPGDRRGMFYLEIPMGHIFSEKTQSSRDISRRLVNVNSSHVVTEYQSL